MPTRFYFPATGIAYVRPTFSAFWTDSTEGQTFKMSTIKGKSPITIGDVIDLGTTAGTKDLDRQFVSDPLWGNQAITGRVTGQLMVREYATTDNVNAIICSLRVVDNKGGSVKATLLGSGNYGGFDVNGEFVNNATHRNKKMFQNNLITSFSASDGDRIVLEIGYNVAAGGGTSPQASAKWGENGNDLLSDETTTSDGAGFFQFNDLNLKFKQTMNINVIDD